MPGWMGSMARIVELLVKVVEGIWGEKKSRLNEVVAVEEEKCELKRL